MVQEKAHRKSNGFPVLGRGREAIEGNMLKGGTVKTDWCEWLSAIVMGWVMRKGVGSTSPDTSIIVRIFSRSRPHLRLKWPRQFGRRGVKTVGRQGRADQKRDETAVARARVRLIENKGLWGKLGNLIRDQLIERTSLHLFSATIELRRLTVVGPRELSPGNTQPPRAKDMLIGVLHWCAAPNVKDSARVKGLELQRNKELLVSS